jgi:chromosome segregation ATPase
MGLKLSKSGDANKQLKTDLKDAEAQMKAAAKAMEQMEKAGKTNSAAYAEQKGTFEEARKEVLSYREQIDANTKALADNDKQTKETIKSMNIQDMTMSQLKQRASELSAQMNNTSQSLSPEAYKKLQQELSQVNGRMFEVQISGKSLLDQFASMHNPIGQAAQAVQGFGQAFKLLMSNPWTAALTPDFDNATP